MRAVFYEANAGTGKTRTLTNYILDAAAKGMSLERICALTFTDKAANEMLARLRSGVTQLVSEGKMDASQMQVAGKCFIGTIHSFCLQLVKRYAAELPLPPIFDIDPKEEKFNALFENRWDEFLSKLLASPNVADQAVIRSIGITTLRALAEELVKTRYEFNAANQDLTWLTEDLSNQKKWDFVKKGTWGHFATRLVTEYEQNRSVLRAMVDSNNPSNKPPYRMRLKDLLNCKHGEMHNAISLLRERFTRPFLREYHASGFVLFDDLLQFARSLLDERRIRNEIKERYDLVLVDEMQDTDAVQYEIILYMCEKKDQHQRYTLRDLSNEGAKFALEPEKLFVVGDPKQSIYGWRNADLSAYETMKTVLQNSGAIIQPLTSNYRSCANLVDFSNILASCLFPEMKPPDSDAARVDLCAEKDLADCVHFVKIHSPDLERVHLRILSEANWMARKIREIVDSGRARYQDIGVLLRKLVHSHLYVDALAAQNIPVIIEGEKFFYKSQEVIDFINLLKFIVDGKDDFALAGVLRSPLFAMTDREVATFFYQYRTTGKLEPGNEKSPRRMVFEQIYEIRKQIHLLSPATLIDVVLSKLPVLSIAGLAYGSYRSTIAPLNILRVQKFAAELESDPAFNLFHFVSMLTESSREGKEQGQEPLADEGLDAVHMMSIHNAKGLDFPIVIVPLTDYDIRQPGSYRTEIVHHWATNQAGLKVNYITEANFLKLKYGASALSAEEPILEDEEKRVLYVAATRAKEEIYFCCLEKTWGRNLLEVLKGVFPFMPIQDAPSSAMLQPTSPKSALYEPLQPVLSQWKQVAEASAMKATALVDSVTSEAEKLEPDDVDLARIAARAKVSGGTLVGLLCHGALENWDFQNRADLAQLLKIESGKYSRNFSRVQIDRAAEISHEILHGFARSEASKWLKRVEVIGREVPIVYFDRQLRKILSGKIDLLIKDQENYCIVDYKTDVSLSDTMRRRYTEQMRIYALALSESLHAPVTSKLLLVRTGELIVL